MANIKGEKTEIIIYRSPKGDVEIETQFEDESIWLSQKQIAELFETDRSVITKHLNNIFKSEELNLESNVQKVHIADSDRPVNLYSLDAIISVGYRVNSKKATDFRIWATKTLREYMIKGFAINQKKIWQQSKYLNELKQILALVSKKSSLPEMRGHEKELLGVISDFAKSWKILGEYDEGKIEIKDFEKTKYKLNFYSCQELISSLKEELKNKKLVDDLFGLDDNKKLEIIIANIYRRYGKNELYSSLEEKAANLFYIIIKEKPFLDGNKRIGSFLFLYFLDKNNYLFRDDGSLKISDKTIIALALLVAASDPNERDSIIQLIIKLIQD